MSVKEIINYKDQDYMLYLAESVIFHPTKYNITPVWSTSNFEYESYYKVDKYKLLLQSFRVRTDSGYPKIHEISPKLSEDGDCFDFMEYQEILDPLDYTGAVIIVSEFLDSYGYEEDYPCYCYKNVIELIFDEGVLITTINHDRAMNKIRRNIEEGLRNPKVKKDDRCINRFIKYSFIGEYKTSKGKFKIRYMIDKVKIAKKVTT